MRDLVELDSLFFIPFTSLPYHVISGFSEPSCVIEVYFIFTLRNITDFSFLIVQEAL